jgi:probable HAF family extracellular repeat protein
MRHLRRLTAVAASAAVVLVSVGAASPGRAPQAAEGRWVMRDLGTFGKRSSDAVAINDRGQVVCNAWVGDEGPIEVSPPRVNTAFLWQNGESIKLTLGGKQSGVGHEYISGGQDGAINEQGQVVGWAETKKGDQHAFLWQKGKMTDLGTLGGKESEAVAINEQSQVVGWAETRKGERHAFLWQKGRMTDLGTLGGKTSEAIAVNNRGQILGEAYLRTSADGAGIYHTSLWQNGKTTRIGTPKDRITPVAINERGQVVGTIRTKAKGELYGRAFLWQNGKLRDLGTLPRMKDSVPADINNRRQVVGQSDSYGHAFLWQNGKMRDLGTLPGESDSAARAINERGQVVGDSGRAGPSFLWQQGKMASLPTPRRLDGLAVAINERGQVAGHTEDECYNSCPRAVRWTFKP